MTDKTQPATFYNEIGKMAEGLLLQLAAEEMGKNMVLHVLKTALILHIRGDWDENIREMVANDIKKGKCIWEWDNE